MARARRKKRKLKSSRKIKITIAILILFLAFLLSTATVSLALVAFTFHQMPKLENKGEIQTAQTTKIFAANGTLITNLYYEQDRIIVPLSEMPKHLRQATIAIEDERFYEHKGYDPKAIIRAIITNLKSGKTVEGASTITQQYIKNTVISREKTIERKLKEAYLAYQLEKRYTKDQILEKYLNTIYFGQSFYGVETASLNFFGKRAKDLTLSEAALLAGIIKSPNRYSPYTHPDKAKARRDLVLRKMYKLGFITKQQALQAMATPIKVLPLKKPATIAPYFVSYVKELLIEKYGPNVVFKGGLRVYTTIDLRLQKFAEEAANSTLTRPNDPAVALVALDPRNGYIKAMVGGRDYNKSKFNLAVQGRRQPGSAFKTFVFTAAVEKGISPARVYKSSPLTIKLPGKDWHVTNYTEGSGGPPMTLREALVKSVNAVYARLIMDVGVNKVIDIAKKMGIKTKINSNPAIALGGLTRGVSVLEMASAYGTLANGGQYVAPVAITKITDSAGKVIEEHKPKPVKAIKPATAYIVTDVLQDVIKFGTGRRANIRRPAAGKTGTAQEYRDAWFVGYTPTLSAAVWVGYPKGQIPMRNVHGIRVAGGTFPALIWAKFMAKALKGTRVVQFPRPKTGYVNIKICSQTGLLATKYCPEPIIRAFQPGRGPKKYCNVHTKPRMIEVPIVVGLSEQEAISKLEARGFKVTKVYKEEVSVPPGQVIWQSPAGGKLALQDSYVEIGVSIEQKVKKIKVPDVIGLTQEEAEEKLKETGFKVFANTARPYLEDPEKENKVVYQEPVAGSELESGETVIIYINRK